MRYALHAVTASTLRLQSVSVTRCLQHLLPVLYVSSVA
jgi:hypothetical protein